MKQGTMRLQQEGQGKFGGNDDQYPFRNTDQGPNAPLITQKASISPSDVHVLVVDDEHISRTLVSSLLRRCNYTVSTAQNGSEALDMLRQSPRGTFQLILTDICMPELNGLELLRSIKTDQNLRSVPVVMMSSIDQEDTVFECVQCGAEEYLVKPVTKKEVVHMWQHVLRSRSVAATVPQVNNNIARAGSLQPRELEESTEIKCESKMSAQQKENIELDSPLENDPEAQGIGTNNASCIGEQLPERNLHTMRDFLHLMRAARIQESRQLETELEAINSDTDSIRKAMDLKRDLKESFTPRKKHRSVGLDRRSASFLEKLYFQRRQYQNQEEYLGSLSRDIDVLARNSRFEVAATLKNGNMALPREMVCCADFNPDDSHFATVSISRQIKVYENVASNQTQMHYPVWQAATRAKLSSVSWSSYVRSHLLTADYDGSISLWDVSNSSSSPAETSQFDEHSHRVWSVQFSSLDPLRFVSGSDDGTVRLWNVHQEVSVGIMRAPVNVCSVQFSPTDANIVAAGCANHRIYLFDLRRMDIPSAIISGPRKAVSYVRFLSNGTSLVAASTDSTIRLFDVASKIGYLDTETNTTPSVGPILPSTIYHGHHNERNFVGLSVSSQGYIATGSEDNSVHCYWKALPFAVAVHPLEVISAPKQQELSIHSNFNRHFSKPMHHAPSFVSAVSWTRSGNRCLAANSQGIVKLLDLQDG